MPKTHATFDAEVERLHGEGTETVEPVPVPKQGDHLRSPSGSRPWSPPIMSRCSLLKASNLDKRRLGVVVFDKDTSHAPTRVGAQESTEL